MAKFVLVADGNFNDSLVQKIIKKLKSASVLTDNDAVEFLYGSDALLGPGSCLVCTQSQVIVFSKSGGMSVKKYEYSRINAYTSEPDGIYLDLAEGFKPDLDTSSFEEDENIYGESGRVKISIDLSAEASKAFFEFLDKVKS